MTQKVSTIVGISETSFADAAKNAVMAASKTLRGLKWARVKELEMELDEEKVKSFRTSIDLFFDIEGR